MRVHVYIFRRDLRVVDNPGWSAAAGRAAADPGSYLLPLFVFNPGQVSPDLNPYYSRNAAEFMVESLLDLKRMCRGLRCLFTGDPLSSLLSAPFEVVSVTVTRDVTPYARARDAALGSACRGAGVLFQSVPDASLVDLDSKDTRPYQVFTPFFRRCQLLPTPAPTPAPTAVRQLPRRVPRLQHEIPCERGALARFHGSRTNPELAVRGGRTRGVRVLQRIERGEFAGYDSIREAPGLPEAGTTRLSAYLKFGCVSVREASDAIRRSGDRGLLRQLYWRAFYEQVAWFFPRVLAGQVSSAENGSLREAYDSRRLWADSTDDDDDDFEAWAAGRTGFPIVDAGMRQLARTGFMHNRVRMVAASFLVKDLGVDWRRGERFFAQSLVDYDPASNSGGWQWVAGGGADAQPWSRVFNPWLQARRYDPRCEYVKRWIPELGPVPCDDVLAWDAAHVKYGGAVGYPKPRVDHAEAARRWLARLRARTLRHDPR
jgi:deoxyribodipyrimidine photo-lyase